MKSAYNEVGIFPGGNDNSEPISGVYGIWCGDDVYVGASANIMSRWQQHMGEMRDHKHKVYGLQSYFDERGACHIRFEILEETDPDQIFIAETKWGIRYAKILLNRRPFEKRDLSKYYQSVKKDCNPAHPEWDRWIESCAYTHVEAREALGLANGTFYRRIAKAPSLIDRLAMAALYEGLAPFTKRMDG